MNDLELYSLASDLFIETMGNFNKARKKNHFNVKKLPNLILDFDALNKEVEVKGLVFYLDGIHINLYPKHYYDFIEAMSEESYAKTAYKLIYFYMYLFGTDSKEKTDLFYSDMKLRKEYDSENPIAFLNGVINELTRINKDFKEDYTSLLYADKIFKSYKVKFNAVNPTGDYKELEELLTKNKLVLERLVIEDGEIVKFHDIKLKTGYITHYTHRGFYFSEDNDYNLSEFYGEKPKDLLTIIDADIKHLKAMRKDVVVAAEIVDLLNKINNVDYYIK
jgi:hypothetical protein